MLEAHPDVVYWLAKYLDPKLGKLNTVVAQIIANIATAKEAGMYIFFLISTQLLPQNYITVKEIFSFSLIVQLLIIILILCIEKEWNEQVSRDAAFIAQKLYTTAGNSIKKCYNQHGICPTVAIKDRAAFYAYIALSKFKCEGDKCDIESELAREIAKCAERPIIMSAWQSIGILETLEAFVLGIIWGGFHSALNVKNGHMNLSNDIQCTEYQ
jgi:hypothetical protein